MSSILDTHKEDIDWCIRTLHKKIPNAQLHEIGAVLISTGCFLVSAAIPDLKPVLISTANIAHQLLNQETNDATNLTSGNESDEGSRASD